MRNAKRTTAQQAAALIRPGMTIAFSGYSSSGIPLAVAEALAQRQRNGESLQLNIISSSALAELDELLTPATARRFPLQESKSSAAAANNGSIHYIEQELARCPELLRSGKLGKIDFFITEALDLSENGELIPSAGVGLVTLFAELADKIIVEVNSALPQRLAGIMDIFPVESQEPIPLVDIAHHIGKPYYRIPTEKIAAVVETARLPVAKTAREPSEAQRLVAQNLIRFLESEFPLDKRSNLPPFQTGFGQLVTALTDALEGSDFNNLKFFAGTLQAPHLRLIKSGKISAASCTFLQMDEETAALINSTDSLREKLVLRNQDIINNAETLRRFNIIALNSCIELDIYGNVNSSHITGTKVVNGVGGGAGFACAAGLSILLAASEAKEGKISSIVPMVSHTDITEHNIDVVITECGIADLRGLDDFERALAIIENCSSPRYKAALYSYLEESTRTVGGHHPQRMDLAAQWHERLRKTGSMQE